MMPHTSSLKTLQIAAEMLKTTSQFGPGNPMWLPSRSYSSWSTSSSGFSTSCVTEYCGRGRLLEITYRNLIFRNFVLLEDRNELIEIHCLMDVLVASTTSFVLVQAL
ncbi:hypothetical protein GCK72_011570 [Caenorhabditis remanei]|uniref:Uncharacterized protein n=1 Tax=Caenorhabditis remanei TaxID=31234 RepID=A0A6A5H922_CAERE|nr:hypothetical protein GCK72_011570 [Caenorhabditis remanei]KAF1763304.1 hypothetical protein GCK72_011570 [Caenorhabditis remanei]